MKLLHSCLLLLFFTLCVNKAAASQDVISQSSHPDTILITRLSDGKIHEYYQVYSDHSYYLYTKIKGEKDGKPINFAYYRYKDFEPFYTDGFISNIHYVIASDRKSIYVIADIEANGDGWVREYQIFKVDLETNRSRFLVDCAAVEAVSDGFIVAQAKAIRKKSSWPGAESNWLMHDEKIDFNGKVVNKSNIKYNYKTMKKRFHSEGEEDYIFIKNAKACTNRSQFL